MKSAAIIGAWIVLCAIPALAAVENSSSIYAPSIFFTPDEMAKIASPENKPATAPADIHLGAVFYYGPDNWTVWLDGARWMPDTRRADLQIIDVGPGQVRLMLQNMPAQTITLKPYQTWKAITGKVVEGMH